MSDVERERQQAAARQTRKDLERLQNRPPESRSWQALRMIGGVGWPIALLALVGAGVGRALDASDLLRALLIGGGAGLGAFAALNGIARRAQ